MPDTIHILSKPIDEQKYLYNPYYEYAREGHFWIEWRFHIFWQELQLLQIPLRAPLTGLDIGCGNGVVRRQIERQTNWVIDGADLTQKALHLNRTASGHNLLYNIFECRSEFKERYDFLILFDILEHIEKTHEFLEAALYHAKPGGWIFVNVPALPLLFSPYDRVQGHCRRYTATTLRQEFRDQNLHIRSVRYWGGMLLPLVFVRKYLVSKATTPETVFRKGFQMRYAWINTALLRIMRMEMSIFKNPIIGSSLFAAVIKK
jgi:2-polyprenyl-3-methyl-5-hydroxy-6-metoxy-1,4-benzoquinol methylase